MTNPISQWDKPIAGDEAALRKKLTERVNTLNERQAGVALDLLDELVVCFDPDIIHGFTQWRKDPRLASVLQMVARLDDDQRDQVLFFIEDLFASENVK